MQKQIVYDGHISSLFEKKKKQKKNQAIIIIIVNNGELYTI